MSRSHEFAGRSAELQRLARCLRRATEGDPQILVFRGSTGAGKSALLGQFSRRAAARERPAWVIRSEPLGSAPYHPVAIAAEAASLRHRLARRGRVRTAWEYLSDWVGAVPIVGNLLAAVLATVEAVGKIRGGLRGRSRGAAPDDAVQALLDEARRHPTVVLADDLHRADHDGVAQLERLFRAAGPGTGLLLVGTYTPAAAGSPPTPFEAMLQPLAHGVVQTAALGELAVPEIATWLGRKYPGASVPDGFLHWMYERSGGHPATVAGLFQELESGSVIEFADGRWTVHFSPGADAPNVETPPPPSDPARIDGRTRDLLRLAASLGDEFDGGTLARLAGVDELVVEDTLAMAVHRGILVVTGEIEEDEDPSTAYRFTSSAVRVSLYGVRPSSSGAPASAAGGRGSAGAGMNRIASDPPATGPGAPGDLLDTSTFVD
jgi:hypothetical protein